MGHVIVTQNVFIVRLLLTDRQANIYTGLPTNNDTLMTT